MPYQILSRGVKMGKKEKEDKRQTDKLRPYRIDYFEHAEMQGAKILIHSVVVRSTTSDEARKSVSDAGGRTIIRAFRFYDKLGRDRKQYISLKKLFSKKRVAEIMKDIERQKIDALDVNMHTDEPANVAHFS